MRYILLFLLVNVSFCYGALNSDSMVSSTISQLESGMTVWNGYFISVAYFLFGTFALIEIVLVFSQKLLKNEIEMGSIMADLIRLFLIFGLFNFLIYSIPSLMKILGGFGWLAQKAGGVDLDTAFASISNAITAIWDKMSIYDPGEAIMLTAIALVTALAFFKLISMTIKNYIFALASIYISSIFFAMGVFSPTRQWGTNGIIQIIKYSAKYMMLLLILGLGLNLLAGAISSPEKIADYVVILFASVLLLELADGAESIIDGVFTGMGGSGGSSAGGFMKTAGAAAVGGAMGAAAGAKAGYGAVAEAAAADGGADNATKSAGSKAANFLKSAGAAVAGGVGGAVTGVGKGTFGKANNETGAGTGAGIVKTAGAAASAVNSMVNMPNKIGGAAADKIQGAASSSTLDRSGFDMSQLSNDENKMSGNISQDSSPTPNKN